MEYFGRYNNESELIEGKKNLSTPWVCTQASWQNVKYYDEFADILDVRFLDDGSIIDASQTANVIDKFGTISIDYNSKVKTNVGFFDNAKHATSNINYCKVDFAKNPILKEAIAKSNTFECVIKLPTNYIESTNNPSKFFSCHEGGGIGFQIETDKRISFLVHTKNSVNSDYRVASSTEILLNDVWYHIVGVWDKENGKAKLYINGELAGQVLADGTLNYPADHAMWIGLGCDPGTGGVPEASVLNRYYISRARIWGRALTDDEIRVLNLKANATKKQNSYYLIADGEDLNVFSKMVNSGRQSINAYFLNDIDMNGLTWNPIGETDAVAFKGIINGGGHKISNLVYNNDDYVDFQGRGLVGSAYPGAKFIDITMDDTCVFTVKTHYLGSFVGHTKNVGDFVYFIRCGTSAQLINNSTMQNSACAGFVGNCNDGNKVYLDYCWVNSSKIEGKLDVAVCLGWTGNAGEGSVIKNCWFNGNLNRYQDDAHYIARGAGVTVTNTYANKGTQGQVNNITEAQITSGELAYNMEGEWGQKIGIDTYPTFGAPVVYKVNNKYIN